jgi:hypothetical protein
VRKPSMRPALAPSDSDPGTVPRALAYECRSTAAPVSSTAAIPLRSAITRHKGQVWGQSRPRGGQRSRSLARAALQSEDAVDGVKRDDGVVTMRTAIVGWLVAGAVLVVLGIFLVAVGLDDADRWASVFGLFVGLAGLGLSAIGLRQARRQAGAQAVTDSTVGGRLTQVRGVAGSVRIGPVSVSGSPPRQATPPSSSRTAAPVDGQLVDGSQVAGPVQQVDGVGGDVEIDR